MEFKAWAEQALSNKPETADIDMPSADRSPVGQPENPLAAFAQQSAQQANGSLSAVYSDALKANPDRQAEVIKLQMRTGLHPDLIDRNLDYLRDETKRTDFDAEKFRSESPIVAEWMSNPDNARLAIDDVEMLTGLEWLFKAPVDAFAEGRQQVSLGELRYKQMTSGLTDDELATIDSIKQARMGGQYGAETWMQSAVIETARQLPILSEMATGWLRGGTAGALAGGATALAVGQLGPQIAAPEEIVTVPGAATLGMMAGGSTGMLKSSYELQAGLAYDEFLEYKDVDGNPLDQDTAKTAAIFAGAINAGLDLVSFGKLAETIPGVDRLKEMGGTSVVKSALQNPTVRDALFKFGKRYGAAVGTEALTEVGQEVVLMIAGEAAKQYQGGFESVSAEEAQARLIASADAAIKASVFLAAPGSAASFYVDYGRVKQAQQNQATMQALGETVANSKTYHRVPEKLREVVAAIRDRGEVKDVYVPANQWSVLFQSQGLDPQQVAAEVFGDSGQQFAEAMALDADLVIPLDVYTEKLAGTQYHQMLIPHARFDAEQMTPAEAEIWLSEGGQEQLAQAVTAAVTFANSDAAYNPSIEDDVTAQLLATGMERGAAEATALQMSKVFHTLAANTGISVDELYKRYAPTINRDMPEILKTAGGNFEAIDLMLDRIRAGDLPTQAQARGKSLLETLREVGIQDVGGELAARDIDKKLKPFQKRIARDDGMSMDDAAQRMSELGYLSKPIDQVTFVDLLAAIDAEIEGNTVFSPQQANNQMIGELDFAEQLSSYLDLIGVDIQSVDNETIKQLLESQDLQPVENWEEYEQANVDYWDLLSMAEGRDGDVNKLIETVRSFNPNAVVDGDQFEADNEALAGKLGGGVVLVGKDSSLLINNDGTASAMIPRRGVIAALNDGGKVAMARIAKGIIDQARATDPAYLAEQERRAKADAETARQQKRLREYPDLTGDFNADIKALVDYAENFQEFEQLMQADMLDVGDRNKTRLARATIALDPDAITAANIAEKEPAAIDDYLNYGTGPERRAAVALNSGGKRITMYRAMPKGAAIEAGDWVGLDKVYAKGHSGNVKDGKATTAQKTVSRDDVYWYGADVSEWVYVPKGTWGDAKTLRDVWDSNGGSSKPDTYSQAESAGKRGQIRISPDRKFAITLFDSANLSTMLHESGHMYLEILFDLEARAELSEQMFKDMAAIRKWLGMSEGQSKPTTEQHEQFARGFEAYLMEGSAPSIELQAAFAKFKAWLVRIYKMVRNLDVPMNPQIRQVFDRLVATQEEIAVAEELQTYEAMFATADAAQKTQAEFDAYKRALKMATEEGQARLTKSAMDEINREQAQWWKNESDKVRKEVVSEIAGNPTYQALEFFEYGRFIEIPLPEGMEPQKLSKKAIVDAFGKEMLKRLKRPGKPYPYQADGGMNPEDAAMMFSFNSADEMLQSMINARDKDQLIAAEVDQRMRERHGDMMLDGTMPEKAMEDAHNTMREAALNSELLSLNRLAGRKTKPPASALMRQAAITAIAGKKHRELNPSRYLAAERKAAKEAIRLLEQGRADLAIEAKTRQILNFHLYTQAVIAKRQVEKAREYLAKFNRNDVRAKLGKSGHDYLDQIDGLLERMDFRKVSAKELDRRATLAQFIAAQEEAGFSVVISDKLRNELYRQSWREMTVTDLMGLHDTVKNIHELSKLKNKLLANKEQADFESSVDGIVSSIYANREVKDRAPDFTPSDFGDRILDGFQWYAAQHTKLEFMFEALDGDKAGGVVWRLLFKPIADAEAAEQTMIAEYAKALDDIMSKYTKKERKDWQRKRFITGVGNITKEMALAAVLNMGNAGNLQALKDGHNWDDVALQRIMSLLTEKDFQTVQEIWDLIDKLWPDIAKLQKDITGLAPEKVEAMPLQTPYGELKGGYYPIKGDPRYNRKVAEREEQAASQDLFANNYAKPATKQGHTIERTRWGAKPLDLSFGVVGRHLHQVIHDVTHRRAIMDVDRLTRNKEVADAIEGALGKRYQQMIRPWLQAIANDQREVFGPIEKTFSYLRVGATVVNMGWKITTAITQPLGVLTTADEIGTAYMWRGLTDFYGGRDKMNQSLAFVMERSVMMQNRRKTFDRDVRDTRKRFMKDGKIDAVRESFFYLTGMMDMGVAVPAWLGAYRKAMDGGVDSIEAGDEKSAIDFADRTVRVTQSSGGAKDLAQIQSGSETFRLFTMFYSYFSVLYNRMAMRYRQAKGGELTKSKMAASYFYLIFAPAILGELVAGRGPDDEEDTAAWAARVVTLYPFMAMIGIRDFVNAFGPYGYESSPAWASFESTARALTIPYKAIAEDEEVKRSDVKQAVLAAGYWGQLPARQTWITLEYVYDVATGEEQPENALEFIRNMAFARPANERN